MTLHHGDCLDVLPTLGEGSADLIYADPPFNSGRDWEGDSGAFRDRWDSMDSYIGWMEPRLEGMWRICGGSLYLHCDDTAVHRLRCALEGICGARAFRAQIAWKRCQAQNQAKAKWGRVLDYILHFSRPGAVFNPQTVRHNEAHHRIHKWIDDGDPRGPHRRTGEMQSRADNPAGKFEWKGIPHPPRGWRVDRETMQRMHDAGDLIYDESRTRSLSCKQFMTEGRLVPNLWTDVGGINGNMREREGYPTQKPLALLERIVSASSAEGDLVFDPFMGSGTTLVAAKRLGRRFAGCDISETAVALARKRLGEEEDVLL